MTSSAAPPRFVPTLTDVFHPTHAADATNGHKPQSIPVSPSPLDEHLAQSIMQRVDLILERRLREAVGQLILAHTQALGPRLREEIELVVRETVRQAVAQEFANPPNPSD